MRQMLRIAGCVIFVLAVRGGLAEDAPLFHFAESRGEFGVGLKIVEQYDLSHTFHPLTDDLGKPYEGERARPLQTLVWYPAEKTNGKAMTVGDYADLAETETS